MLLFDIGANRGDATIAGLNKGYKVIALEPAPRIYAALVRNFIYSPNVVPLRLAVSDSAGRVELYEADEDGLSSLNKDWLTNPTMPYNGKPFRTVYANTVTMEQLVEMYGEPDLIKIDVEGAEWSVFNGMAQYHGKLAFEWTQETLHEHEEQLEYLYSINYSRFKFQFIEGHLDEPDTDWIDIKPGSIDLAALRAELAPAWEAEGWKKANLRPTSDVGMIWVE